MSDADASGARPGEGAIRFSHSGYRFLLGYGTDFFGIWDREQAGGPILRFPRTDEGWDQAWYEYVSREKHNVEVFAPGTAYASTRVRGRWTRGLLYLHVVIAVAGAAALASYLATLAGASAGDASVRELEEQISGMFGLLVFAGFLPAPAATAWLLWQHRAQQNLPVLGVKELQYTPGWAVAWWFIPGATFFMPYFTVRELWKASDPESTGAEWKEVRRLPLLPLWWGIWLGAFLLLIIATSVGRSDDVSTLIAQAAWGIASALMVAVAGVLAARLVRQIDGRQEEKWRHVGSTSGYVIRPPT